MISEKKLHAVVASIVKILSKKVAVKYIHVVEGLEVRRVLVQDHGVWRGGQGDGNGGKVSAHPPLRQTPIRRDEVKVMRKGEVGHSPQRPQLLDPFLYTHRGTKPGTSCGLEFL